jgi:ATP synthase I subunit
MALQQSNANTENPAWHGEDFYSRAAERIPWFMAGLGIILAVVAWPVFGGATAAGFLLGAAIAFLNFHWLKSGVSGLADRVTNAGKAKSGKGIVFRFVLRYVLMGAVAYGILSSFPASLRGFFAGLFLPVGAIACETAFEIFVVLTQRS